MDVAHVHEPSVTACHAQSMTSQSFPVTSMSHPLASREDLADGRGQKEQPRKMLMDRVLVTPIKKHSRSSLRFHASRSKAPTPSRSLRHQSQRTSSGHSFAPYPKRYSLSHNSESVPLPQTPKNSLRRTLSDRSYFNGTMTEASSRKARLSVNRRDLISPPKRSAKRARRLSRSGPPLTNMTLNSSSSSSASHTSFGLASAALYSNCPRWNLGHAVIIDGVVEKKCPAQDMDLEFEFQTLHLEDGHGEATSVNLGDCSWSTVTDSPQHQEDGASLNSSLLPASITESRRENVELVARLRNALAAEEHARKQAEHRHLQEMKRRIEMEELVTQLQREREEYSRQLSLTQPPPSSSPLLLSSSPCTSSKILATSALSAPR